jgi:hypothetical protein
MARIHRLFGVACALASWASAHPAQACGGTFCDSGPRATPVDQKGENILFVISQGEVEAHIQIQYNGDAARFAWVLPVPAIPETEVGSEALFQNLLAATVPRFGLTNSGCVGVPPPNAIGRGGSGPPLAPDSGSDGTTILVQKTVGAFDVTVLQGGTSAEVASWLGDNGYAFGPETPALLDSYVAKKFLFVAVKLTGGAGIDQIHPLVVRYQGTEPCVPLELTSVAAVENMGVRTFFLGSKRVVPKSYKHVVYNPVMLNWISTPNYEELISGAVDVPVAGGHGFVTEYAGNSSVVNRFNLVQQQWSASPFVNADPLHVIDLLKQQGFISSCGGGMCNFTHALILPLLREFLPAPAGVDEGGFYDCLACYASDIDRTKWGDGTAFARALEERVIVPGRHASDLLATYPYVTRMYTTISPAEMTADPTFQEADNLPMVGATQTATALTKCDGSTGVILPDGREVGLARMPNPPSPGASQLMWPMFSKDMPWAERVEEIAADGTTVVLVDNHDLINGLLKQWNDSVGWTAEGLDAGRGGAGGSFTSGGGGGPGAGAGGAQPEAGTELPPATSGGGCGCSLPRRSRSTLALEGALLLVAGALFRRRQGRREGPLP